MKKFQTELVRNLKKLTGCAIASIDTLTDIKLIGGKKNPMQGKVQKVSRRANIFLFVNGRSNSYQNMVKKRLAQEGKNPENFKLGKRAWGERIPNTPFVLHKGQVYLETIFVQKPKKVSYLQDGIAIDKADIIGFPVKKEGKQGGLNNKVQIRTFKLESITRFQCGDLSVIGEK